MGYRKKLGNLGWNPGHLAPCSTLGKSLIFGMCQIFSFTYSGWAEVNSSTPLSSYEFDDLTTSEKPSLT